MPAISAVIPYYNTEKRLINKCVKSVLNQDFQDFEIIIVNDGSSKEYTDVLSEIAKSDCRIKVFFQENKGVSAARNYGVKEAVGEYIVFLDADDAILPDFFSEAYNLCKKYEMDFMIGGNISMDRKYQRDNNKDGEIKIEEINEQNKDTLKRNLMGDLRKFGDKGYIGRGPWSRFVRCNIAKDILFDENLKTGEDILWNLQILEKSSRVYVVYRIWYEYYTNPNSATRKYNPQVISETESGLLKLEEVLDLKNHEQFIGYCCRLLDELKRIYICYLGHPDCELSAREKRKIISLFYTSEPWIKIRKVFTEKKISIKIALKSLAYDAHCFFVALKIQKMFVPL